MTFKDVVILNLDGKLDLAEERFTMDSIIISLEDEIPVYIDGFNNPKGYVGIAKNLRKGDKVLIADIEVRSDTTPFVVLRHLRPCVNGLKLEKKGKTIVKSVIKNISLAAYNADKRIGALSGFSIEGKVDGK